MPRQVRRVLSQAAGALISKLYQSHQPVHWAGRADAHMQQESHNRQGWTRHGNLRAALYPRPACLTRHQRARLGPTSIRSFGESPDLPHARQHYKQGATKGKGSSSAAGV